MDDRASGRAAWLATIRSNIAQHGHHITLVSGGQSPRFAYTIGLGERRGFELILAGGYAFTTGEVAAVLNDVARNPEARDGASVTVGGITPFALGRTDPAWAKRLALGIVDVLGHEVPVLQVLPVGLDSTLEVPDLSRPGDPAGAWRWYDAPWPFDVPETAYATTDLGVLQGRPVTAAIRWDTEHWQLLSGQDDEVADTDLRTVPLGVLLGIDPGLEVVVTLAPRTGLLREPGGAWVPWT